jgi:hypothetical protein
VPEVRQVLEVVVPKVLVCHGGAGAGTFTAAGTLYSVRSPKAEAGRHPNRG